MPDRNITYEIREHLGVISEYDNGWRKELNMVSWNGSAPKYDIRDWAPGHDRMSKGITLRADEMDRLAELYAAAGRRNAPQERKAPSARQGVKKGQRADLSEKSGQIKNSFDPSPLVEEETDPSADSEAI